MKSNHYLLNAHARIPWLSGAKEVTIHRLSVAILFQIEFWKLPIFPFFSHSATDLCRLVNQIWTFHVLAPSNFPFVNIVISAISFHISRKLRPFWVARYLVGLWWISRSPSDCIWSRYQLSIRHDRFASYSSLVFLCGLLHKLSISAIISGEVLFLMNMHARIQMLKWKLLNVCDCGATVT